MRRVALAVFGTIAGLVGLLTFKTHPTSVAGATSVVGTTDTGTNGTANAGAGAASATTSTVTPSASSSTSNATTTSTTVTGNSVDTRWGPVQVKITVVSGKITSATAVEYPQGNGRDQEINSYAVPQLEKESIGQTTSQIDMVSGATYTSTGYIQSLQSALDKA